MVFVGLLHVGFLCFCFYLGGIDGDDHSHGYGGYHGSLWI